MNRVPYFLRHRARLWQVTTTVFLCGMLAACGGDSPDAATAPMDAPPPIVAPTPVTPSAFSIGGTVSGLSGTGLVLQDNAGDDLSVSASGSFTFATQVARGNSYAVTIKSQPTRPRQVCTVTNGSGTASASVDNVAVTCVTQKLAYVVNNNDGTIWMYSIKADGTLTANSANTAVTGTFPMSLAVDPGGKFLYMLNGSYAYMYTINLDGSLTANGSPNTVTGGFSISIDSSGRFAYMAGGSSLVMDRIDANGQLTANGTLSLSATSHRIALAPSSKFAYISNYGDGTVSAYIINADGTLTANGSPIAAGAFPQPVTVDPSGKFVYVVNGNGANQVSMFTVNTDGTLAANGTVSAGLSWPGAVVVAPDGKSAYIPSGSTILLYAINADGTLTANGTAASVSGPVVIDSSGKFAYITNMSSNSVSTFTINADGTFAPTGTVATGPSPIGFAIAE